MLLQRWFSALGRRWRAAVVACTVLGVGWVAWAQGPPLRRLFVVGTQPLRLVAAREDPPAESQAQFDRRHGHRHVAANGIPDHKVGQFPNRGNPNAIREQRYQFNLPADPQPAQRITPLHDAGRRGPPNMPFGVATNGVLFDPGTAEFYGGDPRGWNYEALGGAVPLGIDTNHAHVQPGGSYHYHGLPTLLLAQLDWSRDRHSPQIGWAADGFPIYAVYGYADPKDPQSEIAALRSSYRLKRGNRPGGARHPGGKYDGTFIQDYEYVAGAGDLDACNGRFCLTPEFPEGTYAYFLTEEWPVIPRAFRGTPVNLRMRPPRR
ncbi:MAG: YHYH protein [Planctomycetota bacterium]|nr:MAG: YHYH protein [Planctomycetota bacterium]